jgi:hypothetical protein
LEDPGGDAFTLARQAEQQMLSAEPVAFQAHRFTAGQAQHEGEGLGGPEVEAHARLTLTRADGLPIRTPADGLLDPAADRLWRDPQLAEGGHGQALLVAEQREQQVLGADAVVAEPTGLLLGVQDRALGTLGDAHRRPPRVASGGPRRIRLSAERLRLLSMARSGCCCVARRGPARSGTGDHGNRAMAAQGSRL